MFKNNTHKKQLLLFNLWTNVCVLGIWFVAVKTHLQTLFWVSQQLFKWPPRTPHSKMAVMNAKQFVFRTSLTWSAYLSSTAEIPHLYTLVSGSRVHFPGRIFLRLFLHWNRSRSPQRIPCKVQCNWLWWRMECLQALDTYLVETYILLSTKHAIKSRGTICWGHGNSGVCFAPSPKLQNQTAFWQSEISNICLFIFCTFTVKWTIEDEN